MTSTTQRCVPARRPPNPDRANRRARVGRRAPLARWTAAVMVLVALGWAANVAAAGMHSWAAAPWQWRWLAGEWGKTAPPTPINPYWLWR
jgi:hypothetical protein